MTATAAHEGLTIDEINWIRTQFRVGQAADIAVGEMDALCDAALVGLRQAGTHDAAMALEKIREQLTLYNNEHNHVAASVYLARIDALLGKEG